MFSGIVPGNMLSSERLTDAFVTGARASTGFWLS